MTETNAESERVIAVGSIEDAIAWCEAEADRIKGDLYQRPSDFRLIANFLASQSAEIERLKAERDQMHENWLAAKRRSYDAHLELEEARKALAAEPIHG